MRSGFVRAAVAAIAALAGLSAAACSSPGSGTSGVRPASALLPEVQAAVKSAQSVHMTGNVTSGSQAVSFDLTFVGASGLAGTMTVGGASLGLLTVAGQTYIKINSSFLALAKAPASDCKKVCGKYVKVPASDAQSITGALSMTGLIEGIFSKLPATAKTSKVDFVPATYQGQPVLQFKHAGYSLDVARNGKPYPLAITAPNGEYLDFSDWNAVTLPTPPPASQVVTLGQLGQLG
jgi:hypothetical protein